VAQAFWNWVQQEEERLYGMVVDDAVGLVEELCDMLQREHAGLVVEVYHGPSSEDEPAERPAGMVISCNGYRERIEQVEAVVDSAPELSRWTVEAFRPRDRVAGISITLRGVELQADDVFAQVLQGGSGEVGVRLLVKGLEQDEEYEPRRHGAYLLLDHAVGELDSMRTIHHVEIEPYPKGAEPEGALALSDLPARLDEIKTAGFDLWDVYFTWLDEDPASIVYKLGLSRLAPLRERPVRLRILLDLNQARDDGLPESAELDVLRELEDVLEPRLREEADALYVGRITTRGLRDLVYYAKSEEGLAELAEAALAAHPDYTGCVQVERDPRWSFFRELLEPSPFERLRNDLQEITRELDGEGDDPEAARTCTLHFGFPAEEPRDAFASELASEGFELETRQEGEGENAWFALRVTRDETPGDFCDLALRLFGRADQAKGELIGFELPALEGGDTAG